MERRKVLVVPYIRSSRGRTRCVLVKDSMSGDWTFLSGTCESNETPDECVKREIDEETLGCVQMQKMPRQTTRICIRISTPKRRVRVHVYFIPLRTRAKLLRGFRNFQQMCKSGSVNGCENCDIAFLTFRQLLQRRLWDYIQDDIIPHHLFMRAAMRLRIV